MTKGEKSLTIQGSGSKKGNETPIDQGPLPPPAPIDGERVLEYLEEIENQVLEINKRMSKVEKNSVKNAK